ncbi:MAG: V-type ATP synthase subunit F [Candidatus Hydrogenedentota bacterium]
MAEVVGIAEEHLAIMLTLTGMRVEEVRDVAEAEEALESYLESDVELVVVQEKFRPMFSAWFQERLMAHCGLPLVVLCPDFEKDDSEVDEYLASVIRPAVGYEIRLE